MSVRSAHNAIGLVLSALLLLWGAASVRASTADEFLHQKRYYKAVAVDAKASPSEYIGQVVELRGTVDGTAKCGDSTSFILNSDGQSYLVRSANTANCLANGSTIRALLKVGPLSVASLSDLSLVCAAFDYEITTREKQLAPKSDSQKSTYKPSYAQPMNLASRGGNVDGAARIREVYGAYRAAISKFNRRLSAKQLDDITTSLLTFSWNYRVDPRLVIAVVLAESHFNPNATSRCGAMGLGQLMPGTARGLGVGNAYDPVQNLGGAVKLISGHLGKYGDLSLALSAYNAGPGAVKKYGGVPPYRETQNYVARVSGIYKSLCGK